MAKRRKSSLWAGVLLLLCPAFITLGFWASRPPASLLPSTPATDIATSGGQTSIRIASWNLRQLGARASTDLRMVARIITDNNFDIVAIQEVQHDGAGVDRLLNTLGPPWRGTSVSPESRSGERLTFIYRGDRASEIATPMNLIGATPQVFERVPYCATFRAGNFDFELITAHLSWGDIRQRQGEMKALAGLIFSKAMGQAEKDLIVLGDLNEQKARPNLGYMAAVDWRSVVTEGTNLSSREIYDHIVFSPKYTTEYLNRTGVVRFDESLFGNRDKEAAEAVSDHRPIWADFATNLPDDD